jgi:CRISPR-associated endoribonuclease Cas6
MILEYYDIKVIVLLKKNMKFTDSSEIIGKNISSAMLRSEYLMKYHKEKTYKYVFGNFTPVEKDGIYKEGRLYMFELRTFDEKFLNHINKCLKDYESNTIKVITLNIKTVKQRKIKFIRTINPAIVTTEDNKPWTRKDDLLLLVRRIHENAAKKYKKFFNRDIGETEDYFIEKLKILNKKPMSYKYKNIHLIGNKYLIKVNEDEKSQKLAFVTLGAGLAEKNSILGAGYCETDWK